MSVEDAFEIGQRCIYHASFRVTISGGTVRGMYQALNLFSLWNGLASRQHTVVKVANLAPGKFTCEVQMCIVPCY